MNISFIIVKLTWSPGISAKLEYICMSIFLAYQLAIAA